MSIELPDSLNEVLEKLNALGAIGKVVSGSLQRVLQPGEKVLLSFHQLQVSESTSEEQRSPFGSLDIKLLTTSRFLSLGFYPTYHHVDAKSVHKVSHLSMINRFATGYEGEGEAASAEERNYFPLELELVLRFEDEHGQEVFTWTQDATRTEDIKTLFQQLQMLSGLVGKPLAAFKG
ncbi:MAG: hypothetical protein IGS03_12645 [Candidatus Sericytochromatia bacterium]|nr:hypothetical protein [Candidatus Sericytochromatia bacterium]